MLIVFDANLLFERRPYYKVPSIVPQKIRNATEICRLSPDLVIVAGNLTANGSFQIFYKEENDELKYLRNYIDAATRNSKFIVCPGERDYTYWKVYKPVIRHFRDYKGITELNNIFFITCKTFMNTQEEKWLEENLNNCSILEKKCIIVCFKLTMNMRVLIKKYNCVLAVLVGDSDENTISISGDVIYVTAGGAGFAKLKLRDEKINISFSDEEVR